MKKLFFIILISSCTFVYGQESVHPFQFEPQHPTQTSTITFQYDSRSAFKDKEDITCIAYITGLNDLTKQHNEFPIAKVITLKKADGVWIGKVDSIPLRATAVVFTFTDSLNHRDTNNGKGYYTPLYENNKIVPGAWAGVGDLLYGNWITKLSKFHIKDDLDSARKFYLKDFITYPEIKRQYFRQYLHTFKLNSPEDEKSYKAELEELANLPNVKQHELLTVRFEYGRLKDTVNANKYERVVFEKFPNGSWTVQAKTLNQLIAVGTTHDFDKQGKIYQQFKETYLKEYEEEFAAKRMNDRAGQMLGYMLEHFVKQGTVDVWLKEVDWLTDDGKISAYNHGSRELLGLSRPVQSKQPEKSNTELEHTFFQNTLNEPNREAKIAEDLALRAIEISKKKVNNPEKSPSMTDAETKAVRNLSVSSHLELLGISLMKQNRFEEAADVLTEAVQRNRYQQSSINETYIEALVKAGKIDLALSEIEKIVAEGKSTTVIDSFYAKYKKKDDSLTEFKVQSLEKTKTLAKQKLLNEDAPDFSYYDLNGKELKLSALKNKIVIIDVWASWCPPCIIKLNAVELVMDKYKHDPDVAFVLLGEDDSRERALKLMNKYKNKSAFVFDKDREFIKKYAAVLPTQIIIDKKGNLRFRTNGLTTFDVQENAIELEAMIEVLKENK